MRQGPIEGWKYTTFPTGWFQVAWSPEIAIGGIIACHYWCRDLVLWRGASGRLYAMDANETHHRLNLGKLGSVCGEGILNPVDGWLWSPAGSAVTEQAEPVGRAPTLRTYPVREVMGMALLWYDDAALPPCWEVDVEPETESPEFYPAWPHGTVMDPLACQPQIMAENVPDVVHVRFAHRWLDVPEILHWEEADHNLVVDYRGRFESPRGPVEATFGNKVWGLGVMRTRMDSIRKFLHLMCPTPIDHSTMVVRTSAWVERGAGDTGDAPDRVAQAIIAAQRAEVVGPSVDRIIWENQAYLEHPGLRSQERQMVSFRKWADQFYPHEAGLLPAS